MEPALHQLSLHRYLAEVRSNNHHNNNHNNSNNSNSNKEEAAFLQMTFKAFSQVWVQRRVPMRQIKVGQILHPLRLHLMQMRTRSLRKRLPPVSLSLSRMAAAETTAGTLTRTEMKVPTRAAQAAVETTVKGEVRPVVPHARCTGIDLERAFALPS